MHFTADVFTRFDKDWALVTAGTPEHFNTMAISWGEMGTLWSRPVITVYVKKNRFTHSFMDSSGTFTVSFLPEAYRNAVAHLGTVSGRDGDKLTGTGLTAEYLENGITFREAECTFVLKKLYQGDLILENIPDFAKERYYETEPVHTMYVGEVIDILQK